MERLGRWQLLGPHHASRASTHFTPSFPPLSFFLRPFLSSASGLLCKAFPSRDVGVLSSTDVSESYLNNLLSWREMLLSVAEDPGALLWPHLGRAPHLWNTETHYVESNLSSLSQITADSCWDSLRDGDSGFTIHNNFLVPFNYIPIDDIMHNDKKNPQKKVTVYHTHISQTTVFYSMKTCHENKSSGCRDKEQRYTTAIQC